VVTRATTKASRLARSPGSRRWAGFSGKAVTLAEGAVYSNDPDKYKKDLVATAAVTPASVRATLAEMARPPRLSPDRRTGRAQPG